MNAKLLIQLSFFSLLCSIVMLVCHLGVPVWETPCLFVFRRICTETGTASFTSAWSYRWRCATWLDGPQRKAVDRLVAKGLAKATAA
jgi:hypothetical protein